MSPLLSAPARHGQGVNYHRGIRMNNQTAGRARPALTGRLLGVLIGSLLAFCTNLQAQGIMEEEVKPSTNAFPLVQAPTHRWRCVQ